MRFKGNLPLLFARRYLVSRKSNHLINIITLIAITGITAGTAALFVILSVFNGFENLVLGLFNKFNPDLVIVPAKGKTFVQQELNLDSVYTWPEVRSVVKVLEENALIKYKDKQFIATLKGLDTGFLSLPEADSLLIEGEYRFSHGETAQSVPGYGVAYSLGIQLDDFMHPMEVYLPDRKRKNISMDAESFRRSFMTASGVFSIQQEIDDQFVLVPLEFVRELLDADQELSSVEIRLRKDARISDVQPRLKSLAGSGFIVKNRFEQEELLYKILKSERRAIFIILSFILIIATFNVMSSMSMLILEKRRDIRILHSIGSPLSLIRRIFFTEGLLIVLVGAVAGLLLGAGLCLLQQYFGFVKLGGGTGNFIVTAYPVSMKITDGLLILFIVGGIGLFSSLFPVLKISGNFGRTTQA